MGFFKLDEGATGASSRWRGRVWSALGDSNTEDNFRAEKKYVGYASERMGCILNNYGYSGYGYLDKGDGKSLYLKIPQMATNSDLITVLAGGNDVGYVHNNTIPLGALGDTNPKTSFYGAVDRTFSDLVEKYPDRTIAVITQMKRGEGKEATISSMVKAVKDTAFKYGFPVLDLFNEGNIHAYNSAYINACMPDGVHLNDKGSELVSWKVQSFINSL